VIEAALTPHEWTIARHFGKLRQAEAEKMGLPDKYGCEAGTEGHILGVGGEIGVAKGLNRYWEPRVNTFKEADLGQALQVRTRSRHDYDLLVRPGDRDDDAFLHVTHEDNVFRLRGWLWGHEAKQPLFLRDYGGRPPAFFVPGSHLRKVEPRHTQASIFAAVTLFAEPPRLLCSCRYQSQPPLFCDTCGGTGIIHSSEAENALVLVRNPAAARVALQPG
jgi:hypothetical protein